MTGKVGKPAVINERELAIGSLVRAERTKRGLTQASLAEALGVTFQQIQKYEKGTNRIAVSRLIELAPLIGLSASAFLAKLNDEPEIIEKFSRRDVDDAKQFLALSSKQRRKLMAAMNLFKGN